MRDHRAAEIPLRYDAIRAEFPVSIDNALTPPCRRKLARPVGEHISAPVDALACDNHADGIAIIIFAGRSRWIDGDDNALHLRRVRKLAAMIIEHLARPERAWHIVKNFRVEFLAAKPRSLVFRNNGREKRWRQIGAVFDSRSPCDRSRSRFHQLTNERDRPWRCRDDLPRHITKTKSKLKLVPRFLNVAPFSEFIAPSEIMLRAA